MPAKLKLVLGIEDGIRGGEEYVRAQDTVFGELYCQFALIYISFLFLLFSSSPSSPSSSFCQVSTTGSAASP